MTRSAPDQHLHLRDDRHCMALAARIALRGHGGAEPNPMVGCVIVSEFGRIIGEGYHRRWGEAHAERIALDRAGAKARGSTVYVTLEPCDHTGHTAPCSEALIEAGVRRVVIGRRDPNPVAAGGAARLREAGIDVEFRPPDENVIAVSDPFVYRLRTGLPWVIAKWAQTVDGRVATPPASAYTTAVGDDSGYPTGNPPDRASASRFGRSKWISNDASRRLVHRQRGRVDAMLTGIGTVLADDPQLTARDVRVRRRARRVVIDPDLQTPDDAAILRDLDIAPTTLICLDHARDAQRDRAARLEADGIDIIAMPGDTEVPLAPALRILVEQHNITSVMVEAGPGLLGRLFRHDLVNMAWVFIAPRLFGDERALPCVRGMIVREVTDAAPMSLRWLRRRADDIVACYAVTRRA